MKDLFETPELIPSELQSLFSEYEEQMCNGFSYDDLAELLFRTELLGYTFDYGLDAEGFALRPIGVALQEIEGFEHITNQ